MGAIDALSHALLSNARASPLIEVNFHGDLAHSEAPTWQSKVREIPSNQILRSIRARDARL